MRYYIFDPTKPVTDEGRPALYASPSHLLVRALASAEKDHFTVFAEDKAGKTVGFVTMSYRKVLKAYGKIGQLHFLLRQT